MGWLGKLPIVSLMLAATMLAVPFLLDASRGLSGARFDAAQKEARFYFERNSNLEIGTLAELILDPVWVVETREQIAADGTDNSVVLPSRMLARSQARLDALIEQAYEARLSADPAWRLGVLDQQTPPRNYFAHSFVHADLAGMLLGVVVLLLVAAPLERTWSSAVMALFVGLVVPLTAQGYRLLDSSSGVPWSGAAGLAGALLGAYFIRGLGGHFILPGWILLPAWLAAESFIVRGFWLDDLGVVPWATLFAAIGLGALVAGGLRLIDIESKMGGLRARSAEQAPNPVIARAARLRSDGDPHQAFDLIQAAWREHPRDLEISEAFFSIAVEVGEPGVAAEAILPSLRNALKAGDVALALDYWLPLARIESGVRLESTASVRLGEALLDAGHPEQALFSLRSALDAGVSGPHATRIVRIARDLDENLARRAAHIALADPGLDPKSRAELEPIATPPAESAPPGASEPEPASTPTPEMPLDQPLDRRIAAEHHSIETTAFPVEADVDLAPPRDLADGDSMEAAVANQGLDTGALSADQLEADPDLTAFIAQPTDDSGDVLSHWNEAGATDDMMDSDEPDDARTQLFGSAGLDLEEADLDFDLHENAPRSLMDDRFEGETDSDMTPLMMDELEDLTNPLQDDPLRGLAEEGYGSPSAGTQSPFPSPASPTPSPSNASTAVLGRLRPTPSPSSSMPTSSSAENEFAIGVTDENSPPEARLRLLKVIDAVPVDDDSGHIEIDAEGRGKSKLPLGRIQAISMAAVVGIASRPVLLVDFALNWDEGPHEPLKLIRFRSDRFDPCRFEPAESNPLNALTAWVRRLQTRSGATCLPSRQLLEGSFARYDSLEAYEREVLLSKRDPSND